MAFYKLELSETVVRGMTVYVEAANEEEARAKVDGGDWDEEVEGDPHETVSREIDSVEPMTADELAQAAFVTECVTCGKVSKITGDDFCDCPLE